MLKNLHNSFLCASYSTGTNGAVLSEMFLPIRAILLIWNLSHTAYLYIYMQLERKRKTEEMHRIKALPSNKICYLLYMLVVI